MTTRASYAFGQLVSKSAWATIGCVNKREIDSKKLRLRAAMKRLTRSVDKNKRHEASNAMAAALIAFLTSSATPANERSRQSAAGGHRGPDGGGSGPAATGGRLARPLKAGDLVLSFESYGDEINTKPVHHALEQRGVSLAFPQVIYVVGDALKFYVTSAGRAVDPAQAVCVLVPGRAFTRSGGRLGRGGGHYDRLLTDCPTLFSIGIAYARQIVDEVPTESHDRPVAAIATEEGVTVVDLGR